MTRSRMHQDTRPTIQVCLNRYFTRTDFLSP